MTRRVKVGDVEISLVRNPDQTKTDWFVVRFRPRTHEYLSKQPAYTLAWAEFLFARVVEQEELRQKRAAIDIMLATDLSIEPDPYRNHSLYARF